MELVVFQTRESDNNELENCILPKEARGENIILRMLQPITNSKKKRPKWALSQIRFGAPIFFLDSITNGYNGGYPNDLLWTKRVNIQSFKKEDVEFFMLQASENEPSYIETVDLIGPITNSALQFEYFTEVKRKFYASANVKLQVSFDYGASWQLVGDECYSVGIHCNSTVDVATIYTPSSLVRRVTIPLDPVKYQRVARFRFFQDATSFELNWVLKSFYIGPSCPGMCFNRGTCNYPECVCDKGSYGESCQFSDISLANMRDSFSNTNTIPHWQLLEGAKIGKFCSEILETPSLIFSGSQRRLAETQPLNLEDSAFIYFKIGLKRNETCGCGSGATNIYVDFSIDGGIRWNRLQEIQINDFHEILIDLEERIQRHGVFLRIWEPEVSRPANLTWALDDFYVGGKRKLAVGVFQNFSESQNLSHFISYSFAKIIGSHKPHGGINWSEENPPGALTTIPMVIGEDFIIELTMVFYSMKETCTLDKVELQYRYSPELSWINLGSFNRREFQNNTHQRILVPLSPQHQTSNGQIRLLQVGRFAWDLLHIYVGESCEESCFGRGFCNQGTCFCDSGYDGPVCSAKNQSKKQQTRKVENFDNGIENSAVIKLFTGGIDVRCSPTAPLGRGNYLILDSCQYSFLMTRAMNTNGYREILFVLRHVKLDLKKCLLSDSETNSTLALQHSRGRTYSWETVAEFSSSDYLKARRISVGLTGNSRSKDSSYRWIVLEGDPKTDYEDLPGKTGNWIFDSLELL